MQNLPLTDDVRRWLDTPPADRDLALGATLILRITRNRILYANLSRNPARSADAIEYHLRRILDARLRQADAAEDALLSAQVRAIDALRNLSGSHRKSDFQAGKRADHDALPDDIKALYVENADLMRQMREAHLRLRLVSADSSTCPVADRVMWAREIVALDARYRQNWNVYDHYSVPLGKALIPSDPAKDSLKAARYCFLLLGRYAKSPDDATAGRIRDAFASVLQPSQKLISKMKSAGLLDQ